MEMQVRDTLARLLADVGHHPVALQAQLFGDLGDHGEDVGHHRRVVLADLRHRGDMHLGNHQKVGGRLGIDVIEGEADLILIDLVGRDLSLRDLAKQTIAHVKPPFHGGIPPFFATILAHFRRKYNLTPHGHGR